MHLRQKGSLHDSIEVLRLPTLLIITDQPIPYPRSKSLYIPDEAKSFKNGEGVGYSKSNQRDAQGV